MVSKVKERVRMVDVANRLGIVNRYNMQRTGTSLQGDCPTGHDSANHRCFTIDMGEDLYHCFSCNEAGDIISMVELVQSMSFIESLRWLVETFTPDLKGEIDDILSQLSEEDKEFYERGKLYRAVFEHGKQQMSDPIAQPVMDYLVNDRGYEPARLPMTDFIYWDTDANIRAFLQKKFSAMTEETQNLPLQGAYGDQFRLAIPFKDRNGVITGFMKRAHIPAGFPIGGNSVRWDSTRGLRKSDLFGLHRIRRQNRVIIVEGYPDATYLPAIGLDNIVALGQGQFSNEYLHGLRDKNITQIILALDNDNVGPNNTEHIVKLLSGTDIQVFVIDPPLMGAQKDPDEYVKANGIDAFTQLVENAMSSARWYAARILKTKNLNTDLGRTDAINSVLEFASTLSNPLDAQDIVDHLTQALHLTPELLEERFEQFKNATAQKKLLEGMKAVANTTAQLINNGEGQIASDMIATETQKLIVQFGKSKVDPPLPLNEFLQHKKQKDGTRNKGDLLGYPLYQFPLIQEKIYGLQSGLYIIAADPNIGKTMFQINLAVDVLNSNPEASVLFYSMDDSRERIADRFLAKLTQISINDVQFRLDDVGQQQILDDAYRQLTQWFDAGRLEIYELTESLTMSAINFEIREHKNRGRMVVFIDGIYNVPIEGDYNAIREENIERANQVKELVKIYKIPVIVSAELRKREQGGRERRRRSLHDIMETGKYGYNADLIWLLHEGPNAAGVQNGAQIINIQFAKNKLSGFKDVITMEFTKEIAQFRETGIAYADEEGE
ncbi:MAG: CHC2 zinc finger domain-containing protein [Ignavibacteriales bacterium]|nr:CHC2 zinc finger domain-containing protein [Ignavibacteriales bacterium]